MKISNKKFYYREYYKIIDGVYNSFWIGKFINKFIQNGKKILVESTFKKVFIYFKVSIKKNFYIYLLEKIEKIRSLFKIKSKLIAGKLREYPVLLDMSKSRSYAIDNLYNSISKKKERRLEVKIFNDLLALNSKNHDLLIKKDKDFDSYINNRFNIRFGRPRIKRR